MTALDKRKTGTNQTSWQFYIEGNEEWTKKPLRADKDGKLFGPDGKTVALNFTKMTPIQILNTKLERVGNKDMAKVSIDGVTGWTLISYISKPTTIKLTSATGERVQERQERAVRDAVNEAVAANAGKPIVVEFRGSTIQDIVGAEKNEGISKIGHEKYADLLFRQSGNKVLGISMKMNTAPSLFGGGMAGLMSVDKAFMTKIMNGALNAAIHDKRFELGSTKKLVDIYIQVRNKTFLRKAFRGNKDMGGPADYVYIGPSEPKYKFAKGVLTFLDGQMYNADQYLQHYGGVMYIRVRRRNTTQAFTNQLDKDGVPFFFLAPGSRERARLVIEKRAPSSALIVR